MSAKEDLRTRQSVLAAGDQVPSSMSDLSRAQARRDFLRLVQGDAEAELAPRPPRPTRAVASPRAAWAAAIACSSAAAAAWFVSHRAGPQAVVASEGARATLATPALTAERIDASSRLPMHAGDSARARSMSTARIRFSDGTDVALMDGAQARLDALGPNGASILLLHGTLSAAVVHQSALSAWRFSAGPFQVHVVGTAFDLGWDPTGKSMRLSMHDGVVRVEGCGVAPREVRAPEGLQLMCAEDASISNPAQVELPSARATPPTAREPDPLEDLMAAGRWDDAYALVLPTFSARLQNADGAELLRLGDIARMAHQDTAAMQAYDMAARRSQLPLAWLELAKLHLRHAEPAAARDAADHASANRSNALLEDALMVGIESALALGDSADARARASRYLQGFPSGRHRARVASLLAPAAPDTDAGAP